MSLYLLKQILHSIYHMHYQNGLAHLDLKPDNIVLTDDYRLSLIDFGHTNLVSTDLYTVVGTDQYMAPEVRGVK
jgi:serine/threonine protein kinase